MVNFAFTVLRGAAIVAGVMSLAACATLPEPSSRMTMAASMAAPQGFLDFCSRSPEDCGGAAAEADRIEAQRVAWSQVFNSKAAPAPAAIVPSTSGQFDWSAHFAAASASKNLEAIPAVLRRVEDAPAHPVLNEKLWAQLNKVNRKINHDLVRRSDQEGYGREDYWATPLSDGAAAYGDCEDYVLEKRRALAAAGVPQSAMSAAIVTTSWGETHAVLLVDTDKGEYVLDNLSSFIVPWAKAGYVWRERQFGAAFTWGVARSERLMLASAQ
ncbi:transglutaminase-like cysteine peptidase [Caulobacter segnis]|uniref:transglutaminase-like cysteine peptidase n=1 Tax=Caulobacter segnis TaxID=88688 RepID=UPI00240F9634|nr:transglutaminase-like cysteine peptidase [Caulobacter segnis]MDG2520486.1 transglutaminase-like cysteine peptidase [Caulobacter segnis]